jgi:hypothetical protein
MTHFPPETLATVLGVSVPHARLLLGCALRGRTAHGSPGGPGSGALACARVAA